MWTPDGSLLTVISQYDINGKAAEGKMRYHILGRASSGETFWVETVTDLTEGKGRLLYLELSRPGWQYLLFDSERHLFVEPDVVDFHHWNASWKSLGT
jgi:hypothetical protein